MRKALFAAVVVTAACGGPKKPDVVAAPPSGSDMVVPAKPEPMPTPPQNSDEALINEAKKFVADMQPEIRKYTVEASLAEWANETDITPAHEDAAAKAAAELAKW